MELKTLTGEFIVIIFIFVIVVYTKQLLDFSTTLLGKLVSILVILYYTSIHKLYGLLAASVLIYLHHYSYMREQNYGNYVREGFDKNDFINSHCEKGKLKYKHADVNPEMAEHVFSEIKYNHPEHRCNPCDTSCNYSIMEDRLAKEDDLLKPKQDAGSTPPQLTILDYWKMPLAAMGVKTEPFSTYSQ